MADQPPQPPKPTPSAPKKPADDQLGKLRRELYARDESSTITDRTKELQQIGIRRQQLPNPPTMVPKQKFENIMTAQQRRRRKIFIGVGIGAGLLVLLGVAIAGTLWYRVRQTVQSDQIQIAIQAPSEFTAGEAMTYTTVLTNQSHVDWQNVEVLLELPRGFRYQGATRELAKQGKQYIATIGTLAAGETQTIEVNGQLLGEFNESLTAQAEVVFTPVNFPSGRFNKTALVSTVISNVPVDVAVDATDEAQSGERVVATVQVRNNSANALDGVYIRLNPAPGIQLAADDPQFSTGFSVVDSKWDIGRLDPLTQVERQVIMYVEGSASERRTLEIEVGIKEGEEEFVQRTQTHLVTITASALSIEQVYNDSNSTVTVDPQQRVAGSIRFSNIGTTGLKNAVIKVKFEGAGIDISTLKLPAGAYDPVSRTITWTAASVPELATVQPRQQGSVNYEFQILPADEFPTTGENVKNQILVATATIDSPDIITPTGQQRNLISDRAVLSVATTMQLETTAFYDDGRLGLKSEGPLPPKAGEQTSYTVRFRLGSSLNDLGNVRLTAVLPDGVAYTGKTYKTTGEVTFDDRSGELLWTIPLIEGLTGRTKPAEELHVQVAITPGDNQRGKEITLLNKVTAEGTDLFTEKSITGALKTFPTTETAVEDKGTVQ